MAALLGPDEDLLDPAASEPTGAVAVTVFPPTVTTDGLPPVVGDGVGEGEEEETELELEPEPEAKVSPVSQTE